MTAELKKEKSFTILIVPSQSQKSAKYEIVSGYLKNEIPLELVEILSFHNIDFDIRHKKYGSARFHTYIELTIYNEVDLFNHLIKEYML